MFWEILQVALEVLGGMFVLLTIAFIIFNNIDNYKDEKRRQQHKQQCELDSKFGKMEHRIEKRFKADIKSRFGTIKDSCFKK